MTDRTQADYIVIGSGSSGGVVTRRLVDAGAEVILVEAGDWDTNPAIHAPQRVLELVGGAEDYAYLTVPQAHMGGRQVPWARGRVLGGSSALNGMIHVRGWHGDYDHWAYLGAHGWDWASVLPYFKRAERHDMGASDWHGDQGPWAVTSKYDASPLHQAFVEAAVQAGLPRNPDYNGASIEGASLVQFSIDNGTRATTAHSYVHPVDNAPNLTILTRARALRLTFDGTRCTGVEISQNGVVRHLTAACEVIVSAGAVDSPRLLTLSGIAPEDELRRLGIAPVALSPGVGQNLSDHLLVPLIFQTDRPVPQGDAPPMGSQLWWRSRPEVFAPDLQPLCFSLPMYNPGQTGPAEAFTIAPGIVRPQSVGSIRLATADPAGELLIDPAYFSAEEDWTAMRASIDLCREVAAQPALANDWSAKEIHPGPLPDEAALRAYVMENVWSYWHPVGTCKMGSDTASVVDPQLRVNGVTGLRVADASVMPAVPSGNTAAPCVMIGEKAADLILSDRV